MFKFVSSVCSSCTVALLLLLQIDEGHDSLQLSLLPFGTHPAASKLEWTIIWDHKPLVWQCNKNFKYKKLIFI